MKKTIIALLALIIVMLVFTGCNSEIDSNSINEITVNYPENSISSKEEPADVKTVRVETEPVVDDSLLLDANVMANYISKSVAINSTLEQPDFRYIYFAFMCNINNDQPDFCYYTAAEIDKQGRLQINIKNSNEIIWQVFGIEWDITDTTTDHDDTYAYIPTEVSWGMQSYHPGEYVYSSFNDDKTQVITKFEMFGPDDSSGDPDHKSYGNFNLVYDIVGENNKTFLRFNRFEKS